MENLKYNSFTCRKCGNCCTQHNDGESVIIYEPDVLLLSEFLHVSIDEFIESNTIVCVYNHMFRDKSILDKRLILKFLSKKCEFLENNKCSIHSNKPLQCVVYPYTISHLMKNSQNEYCKGKYSQSDDDIREITDIQILLYEEGSYKDFLLKYNIDNLQIDEFVDIKHQVTTEEYFKAYRLIINHLNIA